MELLVHDVVEQILERLSPKSLLRFKSVSKQWKSTIESLFFQHNHLTRQKSKNPHLLSITSNGEGVLESIITLELESSISRNIQLPWENNLFMVCENSIDGLVCLYNDYDSVVIFNPATRWYRALPQSTYQQKPNSVVFNPLGFGKDETNGLYKPVWLYNSSEFSENNNATTTTCEVFDFKTNAWRFVEPSFTKRISYWDEPVYLNGLLYWVTEDEENKSVLSFDLHTETFEIVCETPSEKYMILQNLNNELCISDHMKYSCVIWALNLEEKTWKKIYFIDYSKIICPLIKDCWYCSVNPLGFIEEKKKKLMLFDYHCSHRDTRLILYDSQTKSYRVVAKGEFVDVLCYFQSLISIL